MAPPAGHRTAAPALLALASSHRFAFRCSANSEAAATLPCRRAVARKERMGSQSAGGKRA
jgi:hypothetical protein